MSGQGATILSLGNLTSLEVNVHVPAKLPGEVDSGLVGVDVSNVCRDHNLPGTVGFERLSLVQEAWREQVCRHAEFHLIADESLLEYLSRDDRRLAKRMGRAGELELLPEADEPLLDYAQANGGCVLSRDRFLAERPGRTWVPERFFTWEVLEEEVQIVRQPSRNTQPFDISRRVEQKLARSRGFRDLKRPALSKRWACTSDVPCLTRELSPSCLRVLPLREGELILCPGCRRPLLDLGPRPNEAELKLVVDDEVLARFTIRQGQQIAFGRLTLPDTAKLARLAEKGVFAGLGRVHAHLRMADSRLAVRPVDDRHRVKLSRWSAKRRRFTRGREIRHADGFTAIAPRDVLLIGNRLELVRSGRSIAEAEELAAVNDLAPWRVNGTAPPSRTRRRPASDPS